MNDPTRSSGMTRLRNYFLTGVIVIAPLAITAYLAWSFVGLVDSWVKPYIPARYSPDTYLPFAVPGFGLIVALVLITLVGFLTANFIGKAIVRQGESLLDRMPLIRNIYRGLKQIFETVLAHRSDLFSKVGMVEWPRRGAWSIVFIATQQESLINRALEEREGKTIAVFRPITPIGLPADWPVLVGTGERVRYVGDALALVAAETHEIAEQAGDLSPDGMQRLLSELMDSGLESDGHS